MKPTAQESATLKQQFKDHFRNNGYESSLPQNLFAEMKAFPLEWAEACQEWEREIYRNPKQ